MTFFAKLRLSYQKVLKGRKLLWRIHMEDNYIIDKYKERNEEAIRLTKDKYGHLLLKIAVNILRNEEDGKECENDTYLKAWNTISPTIPDHLASYLCRITRNLSLDRFRNNKNKKHGGNQETFAFDELMDSLGLKDSTEEEIIDKMLLDQTIHSFLLGLNKDSRIIFVRRYFFMDKVADISYHYRMSQSKVKMTLLRCRKELKNRLKEEGFVI